jgi:glutamate/aspartate transport system substrate-binding protein
MRQTVRRSIGAFVAVWLAGCLLATAASAQTGDEGLSPTLAAIKSRHTVHLG